MAEANQVLDSFAYGVIDDRQREIDARGEKEDGGKMDLLSYYMAVRDEKGQPMSRKALRDAVLNLIIAGVRSHLLLPNLDLTISIAARHHRSSTLLDVLSSSLGTSALRRHAIRSRQARGSHFRQL